jgi:hypothetical protein
MSLVLKHFQRKNLALFLRLPKAANGHNPPFASPQNRSLNARP